MKVNVKHPIILKASVSAHVSLDIFQSTHFYRLFLLYPTAFVAFWVPVEVLNNNNTGTYLLVARTMRSRANILSLVGSRRFSWSWRSRDSFIRVAVDTVSHALVRRWRHHWWCHC